MPRRSLTVLVKHQENRLLVCEGVAPVHETTFPTVSTERAEIEAFVRAFSSDAVYPVSVDDALHGVSVLEAVATSIAHGQLIDVEP